MLRSALPRCLGAGLALVLLIASPGAVRAQLAATLCAQADLISGECRSVERLRAGAPGFAVSVRSEFADRVLVSVAWERIPPPGAEAERLAEDMVVLSAGQTKLVPFQSPPSGLAPGSYRLVVSVAGQQAQTLSFDAVEGSPAAPESEPKVAGPGPSAEPQAETVTQALERVFSTKEGPEAARAGIEVIGEFFDDALGSTGPQGPPEAPDEAEGAASQPADEPAASRAQDPRPPLDSVSSAAMAPESTGDVSSTKPLPHPARTAVEVDGLQLVCARSLDVEKAAVDTPDVFDSADPAIYLTMRATGAKLPDLVRVQWQARSVEGIPPDRTLAQSTTVLRQGAWRSAVFLPPEGGFWPGIYRARVSADNGEQLADVQIEIASPIEPALLLDQTGPEAGINLAQAALGGKIVSASSEAGGAAWSKEGLIDGFGYGGEDCKPSCGWASADRRLPQELVFSFHEQRQALLKGLILDAESCSGDERCLQSLPRTVEVWTSKSGPDSGFELAATRRLRPVAGQHSIPLPGVEARYLKLVIRSSYGSSRRTQLAEVKILEAPGADSIVADVPIDLALPALGGTVLRYSSAHYRGEAPRLLQRHADGKGWRSTDDRLPQELTFCLRDDAEALIDRLVLNLDAGFDAASRPLEIAVALSSSSPTAGFVEAARVLAPADVGQISIPLDRKARFVKLRVLDNRGAAYTALGKVAIIEGRAPGYVPLLARAPEPFSAPESPDQPLDPDLGAHDVEPGYAPEEPAPLELGNRVKASFENERQRHFYALTLPGERAGMLNLELIGQPLLRTSLRLLDANGGEVAAFSPTRDAGARREISWQVQPGTYLLEAGVTAADIVLAWDVSRSMSAHTDLLRQAVIGFIEQVGAADSVALIAFNDQVHVLTKDFTSDRATLLAAIPEQFKAEMATRLYDAVEAGIKLLNTREGAGVLVVMTDGVDMGSTLGPPQFWNLLDPSPVQILTLGLGGELKVMDPATGISGGHLLRHIAQLGGGRYIHIPTADRLVEVYRQIADELMSATTYSLRPSWALGTGTLLVETAGEQVRELVSPPRIEIVLDASGSMKKTLSGKTRMAIAKEVLAELIGTLPKDVEAALRVYGHRIREGRQGDCQDTELVYPFERLDRARLIARINAIKALGTTPIAYALGRTSEDFGETPGEKTVILVTDGQEECKGDLVGTVNDLRAQGLDVRLHVVGFALDDPAVVAQMQEAADAGRGRYLSAADQGELKQAIAETLAVPYRVLDSTGRVVATGSAGQLVSLGAGIYRVALDAPGAALAPHEIQVDEAKTTRIRITKDGPTIGIQVLPPEPSGAGAN